MGTTARPGGYTWRHLIDNATAANARAVDALGGMLRGSGQRDNAMYLATAAQALAVTTRTLAELERIAQK